GRQLLRLLPGAGRLAPARADAGAAVPGLGLSLVGRRGGPGGAGLPGRRPARRPADRAPGHRPPGRGPPREPVALASGSAGQLIRASSRVTVFQLREVATRPPSFFSKKAWESLLSRRPPGHQT